MYKISKLSKNAIILDLNCWFSSVQSLSCVRLLSLNFILYEKEPELYGEMANCRFDQEKHKNETELFYFIQKARKLRKKG